jgi:hypothetical protein
MFKFIQLKLQLTPYEKFAALFLAKECLRVRLPCSMLDGVHAS